MLIAAQRFGKSKDSAVDRSGSGSSHRSVAVTPRNESIDEIDDADTNKDPELALIKKSNFVVKIFNLSFRTKREEVIKFAAKLGVKFLHVSILMDPSSGRSSGNASACVASDEEVRLTLQLMHQQNLESGGQSRTLRVSRHSTKTEMVKKKGRESSRYYMGIDIGIKRNNCGMVGHRQRDCTEKPMVVPSNLCAGNDHDSGACPNVTCYNCGAFGHSRNTCASYRSAKPVVCTLCGSPYHNTKSCIEHDTGYRAKDSLDVSRIEAMPSFIHKGGDGDDVNLLEYSFGPNTLSKSGSGEGSAWSSTTMSEVKCLMCRQKGHGLLCRSLPPPSEINLYCPNCGEEGHHVDFMSEFLDCECIAPRMDAYVKFRQLEREIGHLSKVDREESDEYYLDILRQNQISNDVGANIYFPSLKVHDFTSLSRSSSSKGPASRSISFGNSSHSNNNSANFNNSRSSSGYSIYGSSGAGSKRSLSNAWDNRGG